MTTTLYLPYYDYGTVHDVSKDYYKDSNDYIKAMREEYESTKDSVFDAMMNGNLTVKDDKAIGLHQAETIKTNHDNISYSSCQGILIGENGEEESIDSMVAHMACRELFIVEACLDYSTIEEEFEGELNDWNNATNKINAYAETAGEDWILQNSPKKDIKFSFINKANKIVYMELKNCQILERSETNKVTLLVERVDLIDNFLV